VKRPQHPEGADTTKPLAPPSYKDECALFRWRLDPGSRRRHQRRWHQRTDLGGSRAHGEQSSDSFPGPL